MRRFLDRFSRITTSGRFIPEIDGLRFLAIFSVFLSHTMGYWGVKSKDKSQSALFLHSMIGNVTVDEYFHTLGKLGVCLFFVISGFILALPFAERSLRGGKPVSIGAYYLRRLTRLEPPYLICMTILFLLWRWVPSGGDSRSATFPEYLASCFYLHGLIYQDFSRINIVVWSLEVEVQFYLIAPLIARFYLISDTVVRRVVLAASIAGIMICQAYFRADEVWPLGLTIICYIQYFLCGFLLADIYVVNWRERPEGSPAWDAACAAALALLYLPLARGGLVEFAAPWLILLMYACVFKGVVFRSLFSWRPLATMGGMCYSIYLIHTATISAFGRFTLRLPMPRNDWLAYSIQSALLWIPTLVVSGAFFLLIERPCMNRNWPRDLVRWSRRKLGGERSSPAAPPT